MPNSPSPFPFCAWDIVVVGAGPAGLQATLAALAAGARRVLLLDRRSPWLFPAVCAEGVGRRGLEQITAPPSAWIRTTISCAVFHAPGGGTLSWREPDRGYILDRACMQRDLFMHCREQGAHTDATAHVVSLSRSATGWFDVRCRDGRCARAQCVIDASGPLSRLGEGVGCPPARVDAEPSLFVRATGCTIDPASIHVFVGRHRAPGGGYAWLFPSAQSQVSAGLVAGPGAVTGKALRELLQQFLSRHAPGAVITACPAGGIIPCASPLPPAHTPTGYLRAGDAAGTVNPVTRAGIVEALRSGALAGECAAGQLGCATQQKRTAYHRRYAAAWHADRGRNHGRLARVKHELAAVPDGDYDVAVQALASRSRTAPGAARLFTLALWRFPRLAATLRHLL